MGRAAARRLPPGQAGSEAHQLTWGRGGSEPRKVCKMVSETRARQPSRRNVLEDLDSRIPTGFYWYLAVLACVGGFLFGYDTSNIGSALGFILFPFFRFLTGSLGGGAHP